MNLDASQAIRAELDPGEHLLWADQPVQGVRLRASDWLMIPFSLFWCGFAVFWEYSVVTGEAPRFFVLWGVPFLLVGLYLVAGRFFVDARQRATTYYGLTNERVVIVSGMFKRRVRSLSLRTLADVTLSETSAEIGTISFGGSLPFNAWTNIGGWPGVEHLANLRFELINNAKHVFRQIREAQRHAT